MHVMYIYCAYQKWKTCTLQMLIVKRKRKDKKVSDPVIDISRHDDFLVQSPIHLPMHMSQNNTNNNGIGGGKRKNYKRLYSEEAKTSIKLCVMYIACIKLMWVTPFCDLLTLLAISYETLTHWPHSCIYHWFYTVTWFNWADLDSRHYYEYRWGYVIGVLIYFTV